MMLLKDLWNDECGAVVTPEVCVIGGILGIGLVVGISSVQSALHTEIEDVGTAIESFDFTPTLVPSNNSPAAQNGNSPQAKTSSLPLTANQVINGN